MGCGGSSELGGARRRVNGTQAEQGTSTRVTGGTSEDVEASKMVYFDEILSNVSNVALPNNIAPIVCSSKYAFPIFSARIPLKENENSRILLPVVAASVRGKSRIICFPQISYFDKSTTSKVDTRQFLANAVQFLYRTSRDGLMCIAIGFDNDENEKIQEFFKEIMIQIEVSKAFPDDISNCGLILAPSSLDLESTESHLTDFLNSGGGLAIFFDPLQQGNLFRANAFLYKHGLSYVPVAVDLTEDPQTLTVTNDFAELKDMSLVKYIQKFKAGIHQKISGDQAFMDRVDTLKFHVAACGMYNAAEISSCFRSCTRYLEKVKFFSEKGICNNDVQQAVAGLALCISENIAPDKCLTLPGLDTFPGKFGEESQENDYQITCEVSEHSWTSTGLWLNPGRPAEVQFKSDDFQGVLIQVGSHTNDLSDEEIPWKRWPVVVRTFAASQTTVISTSTGGIVYLTLESGSKKRAVTGTFYGCVQYPRSVYSSPEIWDETCFSMAPWCEFDCGTVIFTLPTLVSREADLQWVLQTYNKVIGDVWDIFGFEEFERIPFRVVYDVALAEGKPTCGYPICFLIEDAPKMITMCKIPSESMFTLIQLIVISCFNEGSYSLPVETGVASAVAHIVLEKIFGSFDAFSFDEYSVGLVYTQVLDLLHSNESETLEVIKMSSKCEDSIGNLILSEKLSIVISQETAAATEE